jgi:serine/threonine protein kinase
MNDLDDEEIELRVEKDPLLGKKIAGRYEIISVLGRGGMGVVYKARQADVGRFVAIKTLHISRIADSQVIQRFRSEAQAVSRVRHPNTVTLYDFGVSQEGVPFLVMDILDGVSFRSVLKDAGPLPLPRTNAIFQQVCAALAEAHGSGIVHKDLKPENIMICDRPGQPEWVYVLDFGIAGMLESKDQQYNEIIGSPPYMSPEQCSRSALDHRSDVYSLGICLFEALSGQFPFKARTAMEMLDCHVSQPPILVKDVGTKFSTYESVSQLISKALEKRPEKRHQSIREFAVELEDALKKDSRRGLQLRTRASLESDSPRPSEFVKQDEHADEGEGRSGRPKGIVGNIKALIAGEQDSKSDSAEAESDPKYHFSTCPHCNAPTEAGISLCLACGRSLAAIGDFSKIRASRGDFSLPKIQELTAGQPSTSVRGLSHRTRSAVLKSGKAWTRSWGPYLISLLLLLSAFIAAGGGRVFMEKFGHNFSGGARN